MAQPTTYFVTNAPLASFHEAVTPTDSTKFNFPTTGLYVGAVGNISVLGSDETSTVFLNVPVGWHPIRCLRVNATGTTVAGGQIVAVWG